MKVTLKHLLTKTSGINWPPPNYKFPKKEQFNDIRLPFSLEVKKEPGQIFEYKPDPHILNYVIEKESLNDFASYADENLFSLLGIKDYVWNTDFFDKECLLMKTRDIAKLGYLYLMNGLWEGNQIISPDYIKESITKQVPGGPPENKGYGYLWWITEYDNHKCYYAGGFGGQYLCVIPDLELIFVITSMMDRPHLENKLLVKEFIEMNKSIKINERKDKRDNMKLNLKPEEKKKLINEIQSFFEEERGEEIGLIAAETVLEFFLDNLGTVIYNKSLNDAKLWISKKLEDIEIDYDMLYK